MSYNQINVNYINQDESTEVSHNIMIDIMKRLSTIENVKEIITECNLNIVSSDRCDNINSGCFITEENHRLIKINCQSEISLNTLLTLLETFTDFNIKMDIDDYIKFRSKFTILYNETFGNSIHSGWCYDTIEINRFLSARNIGYHIEVNKYNGNIVYFVTKNNKGEE